MISKTLTGVGFFDDRYGGTYRGRAMSVCGCRDSGKTVVSLQFAAQGLRQGERCLLLSGRPAADMMIYAQTLNIPINAAVDDGSLIVLEYNDYVPGVDAESPLPLPPEGMVQLQEMIAASEIQRVVLDTCLPWVTLPSVDQLGQHVFSLVRSFDRLGTTTLLTLPKPVSPMAFKLKHVLEDIVPVAVTLTVEAAQGHRSWIVNKYLGESRLEMGTDFTIAPDAGGNALHALPAATPTQPGEHEPDVTFRQPSASPRDSWQGGDPVRTAEGRKSRLLDDEDPDAL